MKIYKTLCIDIASGAVIEQESFEYEGPIAQAKGGSKTTTTVNIPPPTAEEKQSKEIANLVNQQQLQNMGYDLVRDSNGNLTLQQRPLTPDQIAEQEFNSKLQKQIQQRLLGGPVDPETQKLVNETYQAQRTKGQSSIDQYARELAGARGLDLNSDSPALREALRAKGELESSLGGAQAASLLDVGNRQQLFAQALNEFQHGLQQQSFMNRQGVADTYAQLAQNMSQQRYGSASQTSKTSGGTGSFLESAGKALGGLGGLATGLGGLGWKPFGSSSDFKQNIEPANLSNILEEIAATPIYEWNYKAEFDNPSRRHIGPIIEEASPRISEGKMIVPIDYMGYLFGAIKALNEKVSRLEANARTI